MYEPRWFARSDRRGFVVIILQIRAEMSLQKGTPGHGRGVGVTTDVSQTG